MLRFAPAILDNSTIWDIRVLAHPRNLAAAGLVGPVGPMGQARARGNRSVKKPRRRVGPVGLM